MSLIQTSVTIQKDNVTAVLSKTSLSHSRWN